MSSAKTVMDCTDAAACQRMVKVISQLHSCIVQSHMHTHAHSTHTSTHHTYMHTHTSTHHTSHTHHTPHSTHTHHTHTALFELHGNSNVEKCRRCKQEYLRDYRVVGLYSHFTGMSANTAHIHNINCVCVCSAVNKCDDPSCRGELLDTIINFGESLPEGI